MAELLLKVGSNGPDPAYQDGDVVCAFNNRRIRCVHAEHICTVRNLGFTSDGLRPNNSLPQQAWYENVYQLRFERVSESEVLRTWLWEGGRTDILSNIPNSQGERIDVEQYVKYAMRHNNHAIFGTLRREIWYGGQIDDSHVKLNNVWVTIESQTAHRESSYTKWPLTSLEKKLFLPIGITDFSEDENKKYHQCVLDKDGILLKKRNSSVDWKALPDVNISDVLNPTKEVDIRETTYTKETTITTKEEVDSGGVKVAVVGGGGK